MILVEGQKMSSKKISEFNELGWRLYYKDKRTTLYYVRFTYKRKHYYKIGITTKSVEERFAKDPIPYEILWEKSYKSGRTAYIKEQKILKDNQDYKYFGPNILKSGNSELFTKNIIKEPRWQN